MAGDRFIVKVREVGGVWIADLYDNEDHGPDVMYASVSGPDLPTVLSHLNRYLVVAA